MLTPAAITAALDNIKQQVWAVVYSYDPPKCSRSLWFDRWRFDVINDYVEAVAFLGAEPLIIDVDSFIVSEKLRSREIDFVVNLNSGAKPLSNLGLVPSIAEWHGIPCFPNASDVLLAGERKDICKRFFDAWFNIPAAVSVETAAAGMEKFIVKPKTLGNSQMVSRALPAGPEWRSWSRTMIIEEFIEGYEVTVPVIFDALSDEYVPLPPILYIPEVANPAEWFLSYEDKMNRAIKIERRIATLGAEVLDALVESSRAFDFKGLARFDFRWRTKTPDELPIHKNDLWFLEINCLPTLRTDVNFLKSVRHFIANRDDPLATPLRRAAREDIAALSYLLFQFYLNTIRTR